MPDYPVIPFVGALLIQRVRTPDIIQNPLLMNSILRLHMRFFLAGLWHLGFVRMFGRLVRFVAGSLECLVGWFVSSLVREEVLVVDLCERKILFLLEIYDHLR